MAHVARLLDSCRTLREILADPRVSADIGGPGYPHTTEAMKAHATEMEPSINNTDGAEHSRWRRMLTSSFTRHRMEKLRPAIQQITDDLIEKMPPTSSRPCPCRR
ncbi:hypothetical protein [Streptomyces mirabilis]|uniref:hypothetical protein n=1 Tax=Streptomyces mirabilis TaxID=68239 RepID=UPI00201E0888|nr:hypothetical protein [Streptomyces mirabilis]